MTGFDTYIRLGVLEAVAELLVQRTGLDYREHRLERLVFPLRRRMRALGIDDPQAYLDRLRNDPVEWQEFINLVTVPETRFYRYPALYDALASTVLPQLHRRLPADRPLHMWSMATATGAEAYTLAMAALESGVALWRPVRVLGTDINTQALAQAREARYNAKVVQPLPETWRQRYLHQNPDGTFSPTPQVRALTRFRYFNLKHLADGVPPPIDADVALAANVLIYFDPDIARRVLHALARVLPSHAYVALGYVEVFLARGILTPEGVGHITLFRPPRGRDLQSSGNGPGSFERLAL